MTQTAQPETTTIPYPTIEDKVKLFESKGVRIGDAYKLNASNYYKVDGALVQVLSLVGGKEAADFAIAVAKYASVKIIALRTMSGFDDDGELDSLSTCYDLVFSDDEPTQRENPSPNL